MYSNLRLPQKQLSDAVKKQNTELAKKYGYSSELVKKDSWKDKLQLMPPM